VQISRKVYVAAGRSYKVECDFCLWEEKFTCLLEGKTWVLGSTPEMKRC